MTLAQVASLGLLSAACGGGASTAESADTTAAAGTAVGATQVTAADSSQSSSMTRSDSTASTAGVTTDFETADTGLVDSSSGATTTGPPPGDPGGSLRFFGNGGVYDDRVLIAIDDPDTLRPGPPLDVGDADFTIEFWIRPDPEANNNPAIACGNTNDWVTSNIIVDRDRNGQPPSYGVGIAGGVIVWAVQGPDSDPRSVCGQTNVLDGQWHHVAVQRSFPDGLLEIFIDGQLDATQDGADGDISYPDDGVPMNICPGGLCDYSDPFLSLGAEKHGYQGISYAGDFDELRVSTGLRYPAAAMPVAPFESDDQTVGLYHFDEGRGAIAGDSSPYQTDGVLRYGGDPAGPEWTSGNPFE